MLTADFLLLFLSLLLCMKIYIYKAFGAWRSLEAHLLWEQGVGGSNPLAPTNNQMISILSILHFTYVQSIGRYP